MKRKYSAESIGADGMKAESQARTVISDVIELSTDDDSEPRTLMPQRAPVIELFDSDDEADATSTRFKRPADQQKVNQFRDWFNNTVPVHLIPKEIFNFILAAAFLRLESAKKLDISIDSLFVDQDALLCWNDYQWDPDYESTHEHIQGRLMHFQVAMEFGPFVLDRLLPVANRRLQEAKSIGLSTTDLLLAADLCVTWQGRIDHEDVVSYDSDDETEDEEDIDMVMMDSVPDSPKPKRKECSGPETISVFGSSFILAPSVNSDTSSDSGLEAESEFDDEISLYNFLNTEPVLEENDTRHIARDVIVAGDEEDVVDLEVYLCDSNVEDMPIVELAINREGFEYYYDVKDAVDLEFGFDIINTVDAVPTESEYESETELIVENYDEIDRTEKFEREVEEVEEGEEDEDEDDDDDDGGEDSMTALFEDTEQPGPHYVSFYADDESEISEEE